MQDMAVIIETLRRLQEVLAYIPSGGYITQHNGGRVVSFEIVHPKSVLYLTSGSHANYALPQVAAAEKSAAQN